MNTLSVHDIMSTVSGLIHENRVFIELARLNAMFFMDKCSVNSVTFGSAETSGF
jgi:hypothetical protein